MVNLSLKDDKQLKEICLKFNKYKQLKGQLFGFINTVARLISLKTTCEKYIQISAAIEAPMSQSKRKRNSLNKKRSSFSKEKSIGSSNDKKKASSRKVSKKKQSNYLNYKKQINSSRNFGPNISNSLTTYFYSNKSGTADVSNFEDLDYAKSMEKGKKESKYSKPALRKNIYDSLPKKSINERKGSTPANYSVLTDNFVHTDESMTGRYNSKNYMSVHEKQLKTSRNKGLQLPPSSFKYSTTNFSKNAKLPISRSVKNIHDNAQIKKMPMANSGLPKSPSN